jgi:hypothetical protein
MSGYYSDTHPKMEALQIELLRQAPACASMEMLAGLIAARTELKLAGWPRCYPQAGPEELRRRLAGILLGEKLERRVYGLPEYAK